ncbi:MAG: 3-hydroxylacyl-ACP dehydratase [Pseudomonadales bacterium]|nr:3-hydroxylacyl-ACP dehydratase [Pseudomonadales bacterium]
MTETLEPFSFNQWTMEELLPHSGHMVLIDSVVSYQENAIEVEKTIKPDEVFVENGRVQGWVAIEYIAQAIGAYAGIQSKLAGQPVNVGLLIGTRKFSSEFSQFSVGDQLRITAEQIHREDSGLCVFACEVKAPQGKMTANLNVFVPEDIDAFMAEGTHE